MRVVRRVAEVAAAAAGVALAWAGLVERRWYAVRQESLAVLAAEAATPLRLLFFSDLHLLPRQEHRLAFVRRAVAAAQPDLLVSGGDALEHADAIDAVVALHAGIREGRPAVAVLGAHDRWAPRPFNPVRYLKGPSSGPGGRRLDTERLVAGLEDAGWSVLRNRRIRVDTPAGPIDVAGLSDPHVRWDRPSAVDWDGSDRDGGEPVLRLGVVHAPYARALSVFDRHGYDLALAGHTHGGQLCVPGWGALVTNCDLPASKASGTSAFGVDLTLHVSAGLGHSRYYPVRFACRPELSVLDLLPRREPPPGS